MPRIFISYKRVDKEVVFAIKDRIEAALGERCWIDLDGIESDAEFMSVIISAINRCEVMLFMYSKTHLSITNMDTDWTMRELSFAEKKNKRIVFVNIDDSPLSDAFEFAYGTKQQVMMSSERGFEKLIEDLRKWLHIKPVQTPPAPKPAEPIPAPKPAEPQKPIETPVTPEKPEAPKAQKPVQPAEPKRTQAQKPKKSPVPMIAAAVAAVVVIVAAVLMWPKSEGEATTVTAVPTEPKAEITAQAATEAVEQQPKAAEEKDAAAETIAKTETEKPAEPASKTAEPKAQEVASNKAAETQKAAAPKAQKTGTHNGHEYVDLGLPSGVKWASMNVGATSSSDFGQYFAWGEVTTKSDYKKSTYTYDSEAESLTPGGGHDVARSAWGGNWRMPTEADFDELDNYCTWTWTIQGGHGGYRITSDKNGSSIFLPASGWTLGTDVKRKGESGYYWSAEVGSASDGDARYLDFDSRLHTLNSSRKFSGMTVRPVLK